ncbi:Bifunctional riboflavin kinase/FMN adenylyltransferase [Nymphon striatum]|nr:Bifunctional riboflavin kinase/FMN adenylyltransferase [Nymphon striatum]
MSDRLVDDIKVKDRVAPVQSKGSDPAFFSCWDMHSYYGESYIVQGISFDIREGGEQQMLAVARALARDIKLLLLDEPYEGLAPVIVQEIASIVDSIKSKGNFDGLHLGHQKIISKLSKKAEELSLPLTVVSLRPLPAEYFSPTPPTRIYPLRDKIRLMEKLGVNNFLCLRFDENFANMPPKDFVVNILQDYLNVKFLAVGDDFRFGYKRGEGDFSLLTELGRNTGMTVVDTATVEKDSLRVSSTRIRKALEEVKLIKIRKLFIGEHHAQVTNITFFIANNWDGFLINQPYNVPNNAPAPVAPPEAEDLFAAANAGNVNQLRSLLSQGLDINISNRERETSLHMAAARGSLSSRDISS